MIFKVGDIVKVLPRKGDQENQPPGYVDEMTKFKNMVLRICKAYEPEYYRNDPFWYHLVPKDAKSLYDHQEVTRFNWHPDWLEKVHDTKREVKEVLKKDLFEI